MNVLSSFFGTGAPLSRPPCVMLAITPPSGYQLAFLWGSTCTPER